MCVSKYYYFFNQKFSAITYNVFCAICIRRSVIVQSTVFPNLFCSFAFVKLQPVLQCSASKPSIHHLEHKVKRNINRSYILPFLQKKKDEKKSSRSLKVITAAACAEVINKCLLCCIALEMRIRLGGILTWRHHFS